MAADSTILRMVNLLIALSLGVHREQFEQRIGLTCPRPFLLRPLFENTISISLNLILSYWPPAHMAPFQIARTLPQIPVESEPDGRTWRLSS